MVDNEHTHFERGLKNRHIQMIALGGALGTGLFLGSASSIQLAGPAILLSYAIGGTIIYLIMRMLGEMATEEPAAGAFSHFASKYWGDFPGFLSGWNYWFLYVLVSMAELSAAGAYIQFWLPDVPSWVSALVVLVVITGVNLVNVRFYGEFEFWFAIIKVVAIIGMIVLGLVLIFSGLGGPATGWSNLWAHGGFVPNGWWGIALSLPVVMFSFGGTELIGITAAEAADPTKSIPKAVRQVMWRILVFYIGALAVLLVIYPWNQIGASGSPFVTIFSKLGIPAAAVLLNIVVFSAAVSVYNSGVYSNGRMLYGLAEQGNAPKIFMRLSKRGVPFVGILFSSACTLAVVVVNFRVPDHAFMRVMAVAMIAAIITWAMIVLVHWQFRRKQPEGSRIFPAPLYPFSNWLCLAFLALCLVLMTQLPPMEDAVYVLPIWLTVLFVGYVVKWLLARSRATS